MNENTLVAVCGYAGDAHQIRNALPYYTHHHCPLLVLSPEDAPITAKLVLLKPEISYRTGGVRAYIGQPSLDRQKRFFEILLEYPYHYFLLHDSDSVCLSPKLPDYLYAEPNVVWSNIVSDAMHPRPEGYPYPRLAFQPPYFLSRQSMAKLVEVADSVPGDPRTPFVDWCMMAWTVKAGLAYKGFPDGVSSPTNDDDVSSVTAVSNAVRNEGKIFIHSVKTLHILRRLGYDRVEWKRKHKAK